MVNLLYAGFDTLDFAFKGALPAPVHDQLEAAREEAEARQDKVLVKIGPDEVMAHIAGHGMKGGYRYIIDTGLLGAQWRIKKNADASQWNLFASLHATALLAHGWRTCVENLFADIARMDGRITGHAINRVDFAMDFQTECFELHPEQVVAHSHCKVMPYWGEKTTPEDRDQPAVVFRGRRSESITIGKQPGRQIILYDKRREAIERHKHFWFEAWGKDRKAPDLEVWRVEVRAGKKELKDKYQIRSLDDFAASIGDVITNALNEIRYLGDRQGDSNVTRQALHPIWRVAQETAARDLTELRSGLTPGQVKEIAREAARDTYRGLCTGNAIGLGITDGLSDEEIQDQLPELAAREIKMRLKQKGYDLQAAIRRARDRLVFIE